MKAKAQVAYTALPISECVDYNCVKNAFLKAYESKAYRRKFKNYCKLDKLMLNLAMKKKCTLTDGVILGKQVQTLKNLGKLFD